MTRWSSQFEMDRYMNDYEWALQHGKFSSQIKPEKTVEDELRDLQAKVNNALAFETACLTTVQDLEMALDKANEKWTGSSVLRQEATRSFNKLNDKLFSSNDWVEFVDKMRPTNLPVGIKFKVESTKTVPIEAIAGAGHPQFVTICTGGFNKSSSPNVPGMANLSRIYSGLFFKKTTAPV